jgi:nucleotide-binding universal stress UspA family protein
MFDVIVAGTDGSESAVVAEQHATALATAKSATRRIISAYRVVSLGSVPNKVSHHCPCSLLIIDTTAG